jgi:ketosteroid isomerase-like protein
MSAVRRIVERAYEAFAQRDAETLVSIADPGIEISSVTGIIAGREKPYTGREALSQYLADVERIWDEIELLPQEYHELDEERLVVFGRVRARRGKARLDVPNAWIWELRGERVIAVHVYAEPASDARWLFERSRK